MDEIIREVLRVLRGMWNFRWAALVVAWVVAVLGAIVVWRIPDQFEASARIYVDTQSILKPLMAGLTVQPNVGQQINMLSRTLLSRPNLEKLVRMADMDLSASTKAEQDALIDRLGKDIQMRNTGRDNLYTLNFRDENQDKAKRVIQSMVSIFVESSLGASRKDTDSAKTFLNEQIKQYESKLEEAEARVKEFRIRNLNLQSTDGKDTATRIREAADQLEQAKLQLREAENSRAAVKAQLDAEKGQGGNATTPSAPTEPPPSFATPEIDARIEAQKRSLDSLQQRYTDNHPDVVATRRLIKDLEESKRKEVAALQQAALAAPAATSTAQASLAVQELNRMYATAEVQVAALKARVGEFTSRLAQARDSLKTAPQLEAEAAQLNRDYSIIKSNYENLVSRRQSAIMSGELEVASGVADFRLIDPPRVSPKPVAPNRFLLFPVALLAAMAAGLVVAFAMSQLRPTFETADDLRRKTGLPLLGVVSMVLSDVDRRRERLSLIRFGAGTGSLVALFVAGMVAMTLLARIPT
jgi:polysaccharide chain length determinant protein (PEP-CTERM system associated)